MGSSRIVGSCPTPRATYGPSVSPRRCPRGLLSSSNWGVGSAGQICSIAHRDTKLDSLVGWAVMLCRNAGKRRSLERGKFEMRLRQERQQQCLLPRTFHIPLNIPMAMGRSNCEDEGRVPGWSSWGGPGLSNADFPAVKATIRTEG